MFENNLTEQPVENTEYVRAELEAKIRSGTNWFYWIAGLSVINSIASVMNVNWRFAIGLGLTQVIDAVGAAAAQESGRIIAIVAFIFALIVAGIFAVFGVLGGKFQRWAVWTGTILFVLDTIISLTIFDVLGLVIHGLALFYLVNAILSMNKLAALGKPVNDSAT